MDYSYNDLIEDMKIGHEIDIIIDNTKYGISWCNNDKICIAEYDGKYCVYYNGINDFEKNASINNFMLKKIWKTVKVDHIY